jgi:hypothetical protein
VRPLPTGVAVLFTALAWACSDPARARDKAAIQPAYDRQTGKLTELAYDSNHDGRPDTWTEMDGARPVRTRIDRNEDGKVDRWEYYDSAGKLVKVGSSRRDDGKPDAWIFAGPDGTIERMELSLAGDEHRIDRVQHYDASGLVAAEEDTNGDGAIDKWEIYQAGDLTSVAYDENADGTADRRLTYAAGALVLIETEPDASRHFTKRLDVK